MKRFVGAALCAIALAACASANAQQAVPAQAQQSAAPTAAGERPRVMLVRVWVTDMARAENFYRTVFGFGAPQAFGPGNKMFGAPSMTAPSIVLAQTEEPRGNGSFALAVDDAAAVMDAVVAAGGSVERPAQQAHGMPIGFVTDPDGTLIEVIQIPRAAPPPPAAH